VLALIPTIVLLLASPYFPKIVSQTPAIIFYPSFFLATWLGGVWPGLISTFICLTLGTMTIRPEFLEKPLLDIPNLARSIIFLTTCLLFLALVGALQKALKKANTAVALRDEFLDLASHELKTPLTALKLNLETAHRIIAEDTNAKTPKNLLISSQRQVHRLERLIVAMMDLTLFDSGHLKLMRTKCDLYKIVQDVIGTFDLPGITILTPEKNVLVYVDQVRIEQIVSNIVHNAIKYGQGNIIQIEIGIENELAWFSVQDQGAGIPEKDQKRIFERFQRANTSIDVQGLGLGLYLTKKLVELHQGNIQVKSSQGNGSLFTVKFPA
jgi:signal transduction histidine kinase